MQDVAQRVVGTAHAEAEIYQHDENRPLGGYAVVMAVYAALVACAAGLAAATGRRLPATIGPWDVTLLALGTHKLSRTITKDAVTSPLRAPFTTYAETGGPGEVMEEARTASPLRRSVGELLSCPFCLDVWLVTGFAVGLVFAPRLTRLVASTLTALAGADFLQLAYARAQQAATS